MFADYSAVVLEEYRRKKNSNELSLNLVHPTPAKIRNECLAVFSTRYSQKDERILRLFFGPRENAGDYEVAIQRFDIDKFKPLRNLLSNNTIATDDKNIELLAWLIDFQPRPYRSDVTYQITNGQIEITKKTVDQSQADPFGEKLPGIVSSIGKEPAAAGWISSLLTRQKITLASIGVLGIFLSSAYFILPKFSPQKCMYWTGENYRPISCNERVSDARILAYDPKLVDYFKKISRTDTITQSSIGYVWYSKIDNRLEFFTSDGYHPVHDDRKLKPLTDYIIKKYLTANSERTE